MNRGWHGALKSIGHPSILKTRRFGYDGKGQFAIRRCGPPKAGPGPRSARHRPFSKASCPFDKELSVIAARGWDGSVAVYDVPENQHENHILRRSTVPARIAPATADAARDIASKITNALDYVGVIGVELFLVRERCRRTAARQ